MGGSLIFFAKRRAPAKTIFPTVFLKNLFLRWLRGVREVGCKKDVFFLYGSYFLFPVQSKVTTKPKRTKKQHENKDPFFKMTTMVMVSPFQKNDFYALSPPKTFFLGEKTIFRARVAVEGEEGGRLFFAEKHFFAKNR